MTTCPSEPSSGSQICPGSVRNMTTLPESPTAAVIGTGLMGGSVGMALRAHGWFVTGWDEDPERRRLALDLGAVDDLDPAPRADLTVIAVPVQAAGPLAVEALERGGVVTDIGSVKAPIVDMIEHPLFVGGHPMAGSEAVGIRGARPDLFEGAVWVLTPTGLTDPDAQAMVHSVARSLGAEVLTLSPEQHDRLVATVSHVPHLMAAVLMGLAADRAVEHKALLRLAAGGFRDMTRIAAGDPRMWIDVCADNREAILGVLDELSNRVGEMREIVASGDSTRLVDRLGAAQTARRSLPIGVPEVDQLAEISIIVSDRPGELAAVTALATELSVNVYDIEVVHNAEEQGGRLLIVVDSARADELCDALSATGRTVSVNEL